jgi:hypothetical protein
MCTLRVICWIGVRDILAISPLPSRVTKRHKRQVRSTRLAWLSGLYMVVSSLARHFACVSCRIPKSYGQFSSIEVVAPANGFGSCNRDSQPYTSITLEYKQLVTCNSMTFHATQAGVNMGTVSDMCL